MKEINMIGLISLVKKHIFYCDGFWIYKDDFKEEIITTELVREFIKEQGIPILEKDVTNILDELTHNKIDFDIDYEISTRICSLAGNGKSVYFESLDKLYPGNKFREIMNYYLFNRDCYCFILVGYGQTGKTTFVNIISKIIGEAISGRSNVALLKGSHGTALLEGKKFFEVAEAQDLDLDTANLLKSMITNDSIYINPKFEHPRTIKPHIKMIMTCNSFPKFKVTDDGIIRRFITVPMDNKIEKQNRNFLNQIEKDIPNIIGEALLHPFDIKDFAKEQYYIFEHDAQYGFGYGVPNEEFDYGDKMTNYESYREMCRSLGYMPRNKSNFDKFNELAKIYGDRAKCVTTLDCAVEKNGMTQSKDYMREDLPF